MKKIVTLMVIGLLSWSCGEDELSPAEKERRQDAAFDLSGSYMEANPAALDDPDAPGASIAILNENRFHDIRMTFALGRPLREAEAAYIRAELAGATSRMSDEEMDALILALEQRLNQGVVLGEGAQHGHRGGENVVLDAKGDVSEIAAYSDCKTFHTIVVQSTSEEYHLSVYLYLTANRDGRTLDFTMTRNTDDSGRALSTGRKGLYIKIDRTVHLPGGSRSDEVVKTFQIDVGDFAPANATES